MPFGHPAPKLVPEGKAMPGGCSGQRIPGSGWVEWVEAQAPLSDNAELGGRLLPPLAAGPDEAKDVPECCTLGPSHGRRPECWGNLRTTSGEYSMHGGSIP